MPTLDHDRLARQARFRLAEQAKPDDLAVLHLDADGTVVLGSLFEDCHTRFDEVCDKLAYVLVEQPAPYAVVVVLRRSGAVCGEDVRLLGRLRAAMSGEGHRLLDLLVVGDERWSSVHGGPAAG